MAGLEPRDFTWVINGQLATAERIGGYGFQHRRVRRSEEIAWLLDEGVTAVLSLMEANHNIAAYEEAGLRAYHEPLPPEVEPEDAERVFATIQEALSVEGTALLVHRDTLDDVVAGILAGYLVAAGYLDDPIMATSVVQQIIGRPLGPHARSLIPDA
ncbi:MAG: hypothetical protein MJE66_25380 [Proteobacteria bacterium]|nr:hypothetical protein [Pseudomonadota bacterium]